jgi:DNA segregation ATPase FtsK/SpoIIIE-like protein
MARKKSTTHHTFWTYELQNIIAGGILVTLGVLMFLSTKETSVFGSYLARGGIVLFGDYYRFIAPPILIALGMMILVKQASWSMARFVGILLFYIAVTSLMGWYSKEVVGFFDIYTVLAKWLGPSSGFLFLIVLFFASLYLTLRISYRTILSRVRDSVPSMSRMREAILPTDDDEDEVPVKKSKTEDVYRKKAEELERKIAELHKGKKTETPVHEPKWAALLKNMFWGAKTDTMTKKVPLQTPEGKVIESKNHAQSVDFGTWDFPSLQLLNDVQHINTVTPDEIEEKSLLIQKTFLQFGIDVEMEDECVGPTVIQYRLRPSEWVRLSKIEALKKDLTLALKAKSIRIQAPIPGLGLVGIEVPNEKRDTVGVKEVLEDVVFRGHKSKLALALGKDIQGDFIVGDLAKMPHLLIAGQTGSGKSVGMNGFILSLLYKNTPSELRMIMVDPKQVELGVYDGIPHLLTPVINSPDKALNALKWCVAEMERRLTIFKWVNARNLDEYNAKVSNKKDHMPVIVIIIDELADLMMSGNKKEVESSITRIAQKARAAGLHLILATQRPSVDVITGLIKANVPSRVAFTVASNVDSRTILDQIGAEDLLGRGDMLYFPTGAMTTNRLQWVLVETDEVERVVNHIKRTIDPAMLEEIYDKSIVDGDRGNYEGSASGDMYGDEDPKVIEEAILLVRSSGKCSTSMLQRHLKLGYGRAARVVDVLESMGIVGPADGSKPREVVG